MDKNGAKLPLRTPSVAAGGGALVETIHTRSQQLREEPAQQFKLTAARTLAPRRPGVATGDMPGLNIQSTQTLSPNPHSAVADVVVPSLTQSSANQCPAELQSSYKVSDASVGKKDFSWCTEMKNRFGVVLGRSWGALPRDAQKEWDRSKCNEQLKLGKLQSCDERWGWSYFRDWLKTARTLVQGQSKVVCGADIKTSTFCRYSNVLVDFGKAKIHGASRSFERGFVTTYGQLVKGVEFPAIPGLAHVSVPAHSVAPMPCDVTEERPVFVMSNDDIFNLGHYMNDVMTVWNMIMLSQRDSKRALFINFDGIREGGPAGVGAHRLMLSDKPDEHGPFGGYYESWFQEIRKATDYGTKKVCFKEIYFQPFPGVPWFWNDWSAINECSLRGPSPLFQSFNAFFRKRWAEAHPGPNSLPVPDGPDQVHVVVEIRGLKKDKGMANICRYIPNMPELLKALGTIPNIRITAQDFAEISFAEQVALTHSAGVYVSMHGAGTTHLFHAAVGSPNCCALVELQPDHTMNFQHSLGHGNQARMLGSHYFRYEAQMGLTKPDGTHIDVAAVKELVNQAVNAVRSKPSCLHDVKELDDLSAPLWL